MTAVENKIPNVIDLVKKRYFGAKVSDIEIKYFTSDYNKFTGEILDTKIKKETTW